MTAALPACKWRGGPTNAGLYPCDSPLLRTSACGVPASLCSACPYADCDLPARLVGRRRQAPGAELARLIRSLGLRGESGCGCDDLAARMDAWGVGGCQRHREEILAHLRGRAAGLGWPDKLRAAGRAALRGLVVNPLDPASSLLDEALRRASHDF